jgi:hypothetical protein
MYCWFLVVFFDDFGFLRVRDYEWKGIGGRIVFRNMIKFEGNTIDSFIEYAK